jgi:hypothetical protein
MAKNPLCKGPTAQRGGGCGSLPCLARLAGGSGMWLCPLPCLARLAGGVS